MRNIIAIYIVIIFSGCSSDVTACQEKCLPKIMENIGVVGNTGSGVKLTYIGIIKNVDLFFFINRPPESGHQNDKVIDSENQLFRIL
jgi:hypothetical protein